VVVLETVSNGLGPVLKADVDEFNSLVGMDMIGPTEVTIPLLGEDDSVEGEGN
jgi:hypothetical protein